MEAGTTRGDLVRNLMRGPTAIETRKVEKDSPAAHKAADRGARYVAGATTMTPRENAGGMGENELEQAALSMIALWAKFPGRRACEAGEFIQKIVATMLVSARP